VGAKRTCWRAPLVMHSKCECSKSSAELAFISRGAHVVFVPSHFCSCYCAFLSLPLYLLVLCRFCGCPPSKPGLRNS
jgi:hypothetical protein